MFIGTYNTIISQPFKTRFKIPKLMKNVQQLYKRMRIVVIHQLPTIQKPKGSIDAWKFINNVSLLVHAKLKTVQYDVIF